MAKFKTRQFVLGTDSPNLMLAKVSRYTVRTYKLPYCCKVCKIVPASVISHVQLYNEHYSRFTALIKQ